MIFTRKNFSIFLVFQHNWKKLRPGLTNCVVIKPPPKPPDYTNKAIQPSVNEVRTEYITDPPTNIPGEDSTVSYLHYMEENIMETTPGSSGGGATRRITVCRAVIRGIFCTDVQTKSLERTRTQKNTHTTING